MAADLLAAQTRTGHFQRASFLRLNQERKPLLATQDNKIIITLGRQYGSGGRMIAKMLAEKLGIPFYDKELIAMGATKSGLYSQLLAIVDEQSVNVYMQASSAAAAASRGDDADRKLSLNDQLFLAQSDIIRQASEQGSCVIVGRTANHILRNQPSLLTFFVHAPKAARIRNVMRLQGVTEEEAARLVATTDQHRAQYYTRHTGHRWGELTSFDLTVDSAVLGFEGTAMHLAQFARAVMDRRSGK